MSAIDTLHAAGRRMIDPSERTASTQRVRVG